MKTAKRKQVSIEFLDHIKHTVNDMLATNIPQSTKQKLCILVEKMLMETKSYQGFKYLYWSRIGCNDWQDAKEKGNYKVIPQEYIIGPNVIHITDHSSDIQGEYSRRYI